MQYVIKFAGFSFFLNSFREMPLNCSVREVLKIGEHEKLLQLRHFSYKSISLNFKNNNKKVIFDNFTI